MTFDQWLDQPISGTTRRANYGSTMLATARDAWAAAIEASAAEAEHWQKISQPEHQCGQYIAGVIRSRVKK